MKGIIAKFSRPLAPYAINLSIENQMPVSILSFGISSYMAKLPVTWANFGEFVGSVNILSLYGIGSKEIGIRFANFIEGETVQFNGIALDTHFQALPLIKYTAIEGAQAWIQLSNGDTRFTKFALENDDMCAVF